MKGILIVYILLAFVLPFVIYGVFFVREFTFLKRLGLKNWSDNEIRPHEAKIVAQQGRLYRAQRLLFVCWFIGFLGMAIMAIIHSYFGKTP